MSAFSSSRQGRPAPGPAEAYHRVATVSARMNRSDDNAHNQYYVKSMPHISDPYRFRTGRFGSSSVVVPGTGVEPVRPRGPADFTYHHSFRYHASPACFVVWTIPLPYALRHLGRGRLVSTLSHEDHGLSSGSPSARPVKGSPNLTPVHPRVSPWGTLTSPLRLPVPPPGQEWRLRSESNRRTRLCRPLHDHSVLHYSCTLV